MKQNTQEENNMKQNTPEWLEMRKKHVMASDAPIIMGVSPWKTEYELWEEKLGIQETQQINKAMLRGQQLEPIARELYNNHTGLCAEPKVMFHSEKKWMGASLDGISLDHSVVVEIKCPGKEDHATAAEGKIPEKYFPQLQHQLAVSNANLLHYFSYRSDDDFYLIEVKRDEAYIERLYKKEEKFWERLQNFDPPPLSDRDYVKREDELWKSTSEKWRETQFELELVKKKEKSLREQLIWLSEGKSSEGCGVKVQKIIRKGTVDYSRIEELKNVDLEKYRKPSIETWKIT